MDTTRAGEVGLTRHEDSAQGARHGRSNAQVGRKHSSDGDAAQIRFLVGDATAALTDYQDEPDTIKYPRPHEVEQRNDRSNHSTEGQIGGHQARCGSACQPRVRGQYFSMAQDGGVQGIILITTLSWDSWAGQLGCTYVAYGGGAGLAGEDFISAEAQKESRGHRANQSSRATPVAQADGR